MSIFQMYSGLPIQDLLVELYYFYGIIDLNDIIKARHKIDDLPLPNKIDLVIYNRIAEKELIEHINRVGVTIMERNS